MRCEWVREVRTNSVGPWLCSCGGTECGVAADLGVLVRSGISGWYSFAGLTVVGLGHMPSKINLR